MPGRLSDDLIKYYAEQLWEALTEGYGDDLTTVDFDTPDEVMLQKLQENVYQFSAAKNYSQLKSLSEALVGPDGKQREYNEFKKAAQAINGEHAGRFLQAEYNMAIGSGQFASKWVVIQKDKELFPLLEFSAIIDGHTTEICILLNGVIRPIDDILWEQWYPPNHWGERSDVLQLEAGTVTPLEDIRYPEKVHAMFKRNMAKEGWAFPEGHPYYIGNPDGVKATASKLRKKYGQR